MESKLNYKYEYTGNFISQYFHCNTLTNDDKTWLVLCELLCHFIQCTILIHILFEVQSRVFMRAIHLNRLVKEFQCVLSIFCIHWTVKKKQTNKFIELNVKQKSQSKQQDTEN